MKWQGIQGDSKHGKVIGRDEGGMDIAVAGASYLLLL